MTANVGKLDRVLRAVFGVGLLYLAFLSGQPFFAAPLVNYTVTTMPSEEEVEKASKKITQSGVEVAKECGQSITSIHANRGNPVEEIVKFAKETGADLIVTGRRGLGNVGSLIVGSTSRGISQNAECAVLTVR